MDNTPKSVTSKLLKSKTILQPDTDFGPVKNICRGNKTAQKEVWILLLPALSRPLIRARLNALLIIKFVFSASAYFRSIVIDQLESFYSLLIDCISLTGDSSQSKLEVFSHLIFLGIEITNFMP
jgi:hypothetical protein